MKKSIKNKIKKSAKKKQVCLNFCNSGQRCSGAYGLGVIGSAIYYVSTATGFWNGVWGIAKAMLWPAFLIFEVLKYIGA